MMMCMTTEKVVMHIIGLHYVTFCYSAGPWMYRDRKAKRQSQTQVFRQLFKAAVITVKTSSVYRAGSDFSI